MEKHSSFLMFDITSHEANSSQLLEALAFCKKTLLDRAFGVADDGVLNPQSDSRYIQYVTAHIDLGYNYSENAHKIAVMSKLWENREPVVYGNKSVAPIIHINKVPYELFMVKKYSMIPWFCPAFKISLL